MSVRRTAIVLYGYSLPEVDFERAQELDKDPSVDVVVDGMCGEYFLVGKILVAYKMDAYDDAENGDLVDKPRLVTASLYDKVTMKRRLQELFPDHKGILGTWYVTRYA